MSLPAVTADDLLGLQPDKITLLGRLIATQVEL